MSQRSVIEGGGYRHDLEQLVPDQREADEILKATKVFLSANAVDGKLLTCTKTWTYTIWDIPNGRCLVTYYQMTNATVTLYSFKEFSLH